MVASTRSWSGVKESRRRERHMHDLLARSGSSRLHQRVTAAPETKEAWHRSERLIVDVERNIRSLDPGSPDFWTEFRSYEEALVKLFHDAHVEFRG